MMSQAGVAEKMFKTLAKNEINILDWIYNGKLFKS